MKRLIITAIITLLAACGHKEAPPGKPDISPPEIKILYPANGDTLVEDTVKVKASIVDSSKIVQIQLILDGSVVVTTGDTDSLFFSTENLTDTISHSLAIRAKDEWDNWGVSPAVRFFIKR